MSDGPVEASERDRLEQLFQEGLRALDANLGSAAVDAFEAILATGFTNATLLGTYGNALRQCGRAEDAVVACRQAVGMEPQTLGWQLNLAAAELACGRWQSAVDLYEEARESWPEDADVHFNLGTAWLAGRHYERAVEALERALALNPGLAKVWENLGAARKLLGDLDGYLSAYEEAVRIAPDNAEACWNLGVALLHHGQWIRGWQHYESRMNVDGISTKDWDVPQWDGRVEPNQTVLVHAEQGFGDSFQFLRFLPFVQSRVGKLVLVPQKPLVALLSSMSLCDEVCASPGEVEAYDLHLPLLSLPRLLGQGFEEAIQVEPYLGAPEELVERWRVELSSLEGLKVGFGWKGNSSYREDYLRSMQVEDIAPLLSVAGVDFVSLQKGADHELAEVGDCSLRLLGDELDQARGAFVDTAAIVSSLDLVVTTDTALAHLAGGMGAVVWLLLPAVADWRWGPSGESSDWYPTMRIFRQSKLGCWRAPVESVCAALTELSSQRAP